MARPKGSRNADHDAQRAALLDAVLPRLLSPEGGHASLRELSQLAGVSLSTLQHYFATREALIDAALDRAQSLGRPYMAYGAAYDGGSAAATLAWFLRFVVAGWRTFGVGRIHAFGLRSGLDDATVGASYVSQILEPTLATAERQLERLDARGELVVPDRRVAALGLMAPLVLALLHQDALGGAAIRPLDVDGFIDAHVDAFVRAWAPPRTPAS